MPASLLVKPPSIILQQQKFQISRTRRGQIPMNVERASSLVAESRP
jgi:hypothetical protein